MTALLDRLAERVAEVQAGRHARECAGGFVLGLSGGVDSVTLLEAMCRLGLRERLRCLHVDHGLHPDSSAWAQFCSELAARAGVPLQALSVQCAAAPGVSLEAAAREARYAALAGELRAGEILLTAHHGDDQLETLLFRLLRGTGVDGLAGIRGFAPFARGYILRPWLDVGRAEILAQARAWGLRWIDDPANADQRFDRNYLRHAALPNLLERWPAAPGAAARLAAAAADAGSLAADLAQLDLEGLEPFDCLPLERLAGLSAARLRNVLRYAIRCLDLPLPDAGALARLQALAGAHTATGVVIWPGGEAHRYEAALYLRCTRVRLPTQPQTLLPGASCAIGDGRLVLEPAAAPALPDAWVQRGLSVKFRSGGERFRPTGSHRSGELREWMRASGLLPWMRDRIPLLYFGDELVAVADIGLSAAAVCDDDEGGWRIAWRERPRTHAATR